MQRIFSFVSSLPSFFSFSSSSNEKMAANLSAAGLRVDGAKYLSGAFTLSSACFLLSFLFFMFFFSFFEAFGGSLLVFSLLFGFFIIMPNASVRAREKQKEAELPFLLRELAIYLEIGLPFEKSIGKIAKRDYALSDDFEECCKAIKSGSTVQASLADMASKSNSLAIKRAVFLLSNVYETGTGTDALKRMAEELSLSQISSMRMQSSRLSLLTIVFIVVSALIPSFFTVFAAVSPTVSSGIEEWQVFLTFIFIFPFLCAASLSFMLFLLPPSGKRSESNLLLDEYFLKKFRVGRNIVIFALVGISVIFAALFLLLGNIFLSALSLCTAPSLYSLFAYFAGREVEGAEKMLPDALYSAAATHRLMSAEKMLSFLSKGGFGRMSQAFELALRRQKAGESFSASMSAASAYCPSPLVERAFMLLVVSYETGADMYFALRETAQDIASFFTLVRERAALLSIQRYTVLASCALLVPVILGTVVFLAPTLSEAAVFSGENASAVASLPFACQIYLLFNAAISSILLSFAETNPMRAALYFAFCAPVSQAAFAIVSSGAM